MYAVAHLLSVHDIICSKLGYQSLTGKEIALKYVALPFPVINEVKRLQIIDRTIQERPAVYGFGRRCCRVRCDWDASRDRFSYL